MQVQTCRRCKKDQICGVIFTQWKSLFPRGVGINLKILTFLAILTFLENNMKRKKMRLKRRKRKRNILTKTELKSFWVNLCTSHPIVHILIRRRSQLRINYSPIVHRRYGLLYPCPGVQSLCLQGWAVHVAEHCHPETLETRSMWGSGSDVAWYGAGWWLMIGSLKSLGYIALGATFDKVRIGRISPSCSSGEKYQQLTK